MAHFADRYASYDLHNHTWWSYDALAAPDTYFRRARALGMRCIAVTDHHLFDAWDELRVVREAYPEIRLIPAAEMSVETSLGAVDLLCYGLPEKPSTALKDVFNFFRRWQQEAALAIARGLTEMGVPFSGEDMRALLLTYRPAKTLALQGVTHPKNQVLQAWLLERKIISAPDEYVAFKRKVYAAAGADSYPKYSEVVPALKEAGALIVIAHPFGYFGGFEIERIQTLRDECQLDGIECAHPGVPPEFTQKYRTYCVEHRLLSTGGTDNHTDEDARQHLGRHEGQEAWLDELLARLDNR